jgi:hypothetical protein
MTTPRTMSEIRADYDKIINDFWADDQKASAPDALEQLEVVERPIREELEAWFKQNTTID